jgi:hypothetical protein
MKISRLIVLGLIGMVLTFGLAGCKKITSASPDPSMTVEMRLGESKTFSVDGPAQNFITNVYNWSVDHIDMGGYGKKFTITADPQKYRLANRMRVTCELGQSMLVPVCGPQAGDPCRLGFGWVIADQKSWNIRIVQDGPVWQGDYYIADNTDLQVLKDFTMITGSLIIEDTKLKSLAGLENITSVGGDLDIYNNDALTSLAALENITSVGGRLMISTNNALTSLKGLESITSIGGGLGIDSNNALTSLTGLEKITSVGRSLSISYNKTLTSIAPLGNITSIGGALYICNNRALTSLTGLGNITSEIGGLRITYNNALTSLAPLGNITSIRGDLSIAVNDTLTSLGMNALLRVGGDYNITDNPMLCTSLAEELMNQVLTGSGIGGEANIEGNKDCTTP